MVSKNHCSEPWFPRKFFFREVFYLSPHIKGLIKLPDSTSEGPKLTDNKLEVSYMWSRSLTKGDVIVDNLTTEDYRTAVRERQRNGPGHFHVMTISSSLYVGGDEKKTEPPITTTKNLNVRFCS